ncbi:MAG: restriction endonuclease [Ktedonobacteraceae bacterium]
MRSKQSMSRKRSSSGRKQASAASKRLQTKKRSSGLWVLLVVVLLAMGAWTLTRVPPGLLVIGSIVGLLVVLLLLGAWLAFRLRPSVEEQNWRSGQELEHVQMQDTARALGVRPVELDDLEHLKHHEFEYFIGALLETAGVAFDLERVGGAGDRGVDLRGKDHFDRPFIVQCKRYFGHKVTPKETREFRGARQSHGADVAWFVTTSSFTRQAEQEVGDLHHRGLLVLVDGVKLVALIRDHWDALPTRWQWRLTECMTVRDRRRDAE